MAIGSPLLQTESLLEKIEIGPCPYDQDTAKSNQGDEGEIKLKPVQDRGSPVSEGPAAASWNERYRGLNAGARAALKNKSVVPAFEVGRAACLKIRDSFRAKRG